MLALNLLLQFETVEPFPQYKIFISKRNSTKTVQLSVAIRFFKQLEDIEVAQSFTIKEQQIAGMTIRTEKTFRRRNSSHKIKQEQIILYIHHFGREKLSGGYKIILHSIIQKTITLYSGYFFFQINAFYNDFTDSSFSLKLFCIQQRRKFMEQIYGIMSIFFAKS